MPSKEMKRKLYLVVGFYAFYAIFFNDDGRRLASELKDLEFVHITHTGGYAIEKAAGNAGVNWGACHYLPIKEFGCTKPDFALKGNDYQEGGKANFVLRNIWHTAPKYVKEAVPEKENPYYGKDLFTIVRNPYERVIAEYYCPYNGYKGKWNIDAAGTMNDWLHSVLNTNLVDLESFSKQRKERKMKEISVNKVFADKHFLPQVDYVYDDEGHRVIKYVLHYENLSSEFKEITTKYDLDMHLDPTNDGEQHIGSLSHIDFDAETIGLINKLYADDFKAFGYEKVEKFDTFSPYHTSAKVNPCKTFKHGDKECKREETTFVSNESLAAAETPIGVSHSTTFLLGIFSEMTEKGAVFRDLARKTYLNIDDPRICSWQEYKKQKTDLMVSTCSVPYVFVVGGNPKRPEEHYDKEPLYVDGSLVEGASEDENDILFLNIAENDNHGKAAAYLKWAAAAGSTLQVDFAAKVAFDTLVDIPLLLDFIELDLPAAPYNRRMYGGGIWGYWWEGGYYATKPFYFLSLDLAAFVGTRQIDWTKDEAHDIGRFVFKHPKPIKFVNMNPRLLWHEGLNSEDAWADAWNNRMGELPITKPSIENTKICQAFKDEGKMK